MQHIEGMSTTAEQDKIATMKWSFLITSILNLLCMIACGWCAVGITAAEMDDQDDFEVQLPPMVQRNSVKNNQPAANYLVNRDTRDHDGIEPMN